MSTTTTTTPLRVFGVRHLSPGAAFHLRAYLDEVKPTIVLVEGIADATELIPSILHKKTVPPIAILAYTDELPVQTIVSPLARYSPEFQALAWAKENKVEAQFIDLPSSHFLAIERRRIQKLHEKLEQQMKEMAENEEQFEEAQKTRDALRARAAGDGDDEDDADDSDDVAQLAAQLTGKGKTDDKDEKKDDEAKPAFDPASDRYAPENIGSRRSLYDRIAHLSGEPDYETWWERHFEHNIGNEVYRRSANEFGARLREMEEEFPYERDEDHIAETLVREAYMRRCIQAAIADGHEPDRIAVIVGAFHAPVMTLDHPAMSDEELANLPDEPSKLTLMPYSYFKLSSQSGYGAGNQAPAYFEMMWSCLERGELHELPGEYLAQMVTLLRDSGTFRSTAEVIEAVRLATTIAALRDSLAPTLRELQDAATTLLGQGQVSVIADARARVEVGTAVGELPPGVSQTSIQDDFAYKLRDLKLADYRTTVAQDLDLDLRENRRAKTEDAAFRDLHRSVFFHQLQVLGIGFAKKKASKSGLTAKEYWVLQWTPEYEIALVESVLLGETIELAAAFRLRTRLEQCESVADAAAIVREAGECLMLDVMSHARQTLQALAAESTDFGAIADACHELGLVVRFGDVRGFDPSPLVPLITQFVVEGSLMLDHTANCDNDTANRIWPAMATFNETIDQFSDFVDEELWERSLQSLASRDDRNPLLSGFAAALLLKRGVMDDDELTREVSRRLSPGIEADLGAGWFEGLSKQNRHALLSRMRLWEALATYVQALDKEQFMRALVFLRRCFGDFSRDERRAITELLGEHWGVSAHALGEVMEQTLTEGEQQTLDSLGDFDFDDL